MPRTQIYGQALGEVVSVNDRECQAKLSFQFVLPLAHHAGRRGDDYVVDPPAQEQFANHKTSLDRLAQANIVSDQQVDPRKP